MSELTAVLDFLSSSSEIKTDVATSIEEVTEIINEKTEIISPFDIQKFGQELEKFSGQRNVERASRAHQNITGYDIAHNCIAQVLFKLRNTPVPNMSDPWLPIFMRVELGNAVHSFIQTNTAQFTETELNLKVPSIGFYGKIDFMCGPNILGEIKSCTYTDYAKVIRTKQPREKDFLQAMCYQYIISNFIDEIKSDDVKIYHGMGEKPKHDKYDIKQLQFIYVAHDIMSSDLESMSEIQNSVKQTKKILDSKKNPFFFITTLLIDLDEETRKQCDDWISGKFDDIHYYMKTNTDPKQDARYLNRTGCFFCAYESICKYKK